ncbi:MAG: hypothetical protein V1855_03410 [bacterium]
MFKIQKIKKCFFLLALAFVLGEKAVFCMFSSPYPYERMYSRYSSSDVGWGRNLAQLDFIAKAKDEINGKLEELKKNEEKSETVKTQIKLYEGALDNWSNQEKLLLSGQNSGSGLIIARSIAGHDNAYVLNDSDIKTVLDGIRQGLVIQLGTAFGETIRKKAEFTTDKLVGGTFDYCWAKFSDFSNAINSAIFHSSKKPFDDKKLEGWQKFITSCLDDIDLMLKTGLKDSTRGLDSTVRQFEGVSAESEEENLEDEEIRFNVWAALASSYVGQFQFFIKLFESRKLYYKNEELVIFYVDQICQILNSVCVLLSSAKTLRDMDTLLDSHRSIIPALKKNLNNLFMQLTGEVKPRSYSLKDKKTPSSSGSNDWSSRKNNYSGYNWGGGGYGLNDDFPGSFSPYTGV